MKQSVYLLMLLVLGGFFCLCCKSPPPPETETEEELNVVIELPPEEEALPVSVFSEIWAYVVAEREAALVPGLPISDICYFSADIGTYGSLIDVPKRSKLPRFSGRVHLVVKCDGRALTHFILKPGSDERKTLILDLLAATKDFDGLQVDFENIPPRDGGNFLSFLRELRAGLESNKMFTIALPARTRKLADDLYDYENILPIVDRILVMAYDEHWSRSAPGPIASLSWCRNVANYSFKTIGREKLIMGLPFYGRAWAKPDHAMALVYTQVERVIRENNVTEFSREEGIPTFNYQIPVNVNVYYDDEYSTSARMEMYRNIGVSKIGFWRLGQETPSVWNYIKLEK